jgi:hypothetical protein
MQFANLSVSYVMGKSDSELDIRQTCYILNKHIITYMSDYGRGLDW